MSPSVSLASFTTAALTSAALAFSLAGCLGDPPNSPGARGQTVPLHVKPASYTKRDIPRTPMVTHHVLETTDDCGNNCEFLQNADAELMIHLSDNGVAAAADSGELVERLRSSVSSTAQQTTWQRKWRGSWSEGDDSLEVVLKPEEVTCKRVSEDGAVDDACAKRRELRLRCRLVSLALVRPRNTSTRGWACRSRGHKNTEALTPLPWVFGIDKSLVLLDGGTSHEPTRRYAVAKAE